MIPGFSPVLKTANCDEREVSWQSSGPPLSWLGLILASPPPSNNNTQTHGIKQASMSHLGFLLPFIHLPSIIHPSLPIHLLVCSFVP